MTQEHKRQNTLFIDFLHYSAEYNIINADYNPETNVTQSEYQTELKITHLSCSKLRGRNNENYSMNHTKYTESLHNSEKNILFGARHNLENPSSHISEICICRASKKKNPHQSHLRSFLYQSH